MLPDFFKPYTQNFRRYNGKSMFNGMAIAFRGIDTSDGRTRVKVYPTDYYDYQNKVGLRELYCVKVIDKEFNLINNDSSRISRLLCRIRHRDPLVKLWRKIDPSDVTNRPVVIGPAPYVLSEG